MIGKQGAGTMVLEASEQSERAAGEVVSGVGGGLKLAEYIEKVLK